MEGINQGPNRKQQAHSKEAYSGEFNKQAIHKGVDKATKGGEVSPALATDGSSPEAQRSRRREILPEP